MRTITGLGGPPAIAVRTPRPLRHRVAIGAVVVVAIDQSSKLLAPRFDHGPLGVAIEPGLNRGYSLGLVTAPGALLVLVTVATLLAGCAWVAGQLRAGRISPWGVSVVLGGAASNLIDRVTRGGVLDFIATPWIVLNLADLAVLGGICAMSMSSLRSTLDRTEGGDPHE